MKKLIAAVAIVCAAVVANAASYDWGAYGAFYWNDGSATGEELSGATIYAFDGNVYNLSTVMSALAGGDTSVLGNALASGVVDEYASYAFNGSGITDDGNDPAYINAFLVAVTSDGKYATASSIDPIKVTDAVVAAGADIGVADWAMDNLPGSGVAGWTEVAAVPEPTSGLLLLLGMAGLALRRRRA